MEIFRGEIFHEADSHDPRTAAISAFGTLSKARGLSPAIIRFPVFPLGYLRDVETQRTASLEFTFHAL